MLLTPSPYTQAGTLGFPLYSDDLLLFGKKHDKELLNWIRHKKTTTCGHVCFLRDSSSKISVKPRIN